MNQKKGLSIKYTYITSNAQHPRDQRQEENGQQEN